MSSAQCPMISVQPVVTRVIEGMVQGGALAFSEQYQPGPGCVRALEGARLECSVVAWSDTMPLTYQWLKDGVPVQGAVGADQWIAVDAGDGGRTLALTVCVSNAAGQVVSDAAYVSVAAVQRQQGQALMGIEGGKISLGDAVDLEVPAGALAEVTAVALRLQSPASYVLPADFFPVSGVIELEPSCVKFSSPVALSVPQTIGTHPSFRLVLLDLTGALPALLAPMSSSGASGGNVSVGHPTGYTCYVVNGDAYVGGRVYGGVAQGGRYLWGLMKRPDSMSVPASAEPSAFDLEKTPPRITNGDLGDDDLGSWHVWERLEAALVENAPELLAGLNPPATEEQLLAAEAELGMRLPRELRYAYSRHDGQICGWSPPFYPSFFLSYHWQPLTELLRIWRMHMDLDQTFRDERRDMGAGSLWHQGKVLSLDFWYPGWLPLGTEGAAGTLFLDLSPGDTGAVGQLVNGRDIDTDDESVLANSLNEYLSCFTDCLVEKKLQLVAGSGWTEPHGETVFISDLMKVRAGWII